MDRCRQFEYWIIGAGTYQTTAEMFDALNELGKKGWELVSAPSIHNGGTLYFKRELRKVSHR